MLLALMAVVLVLLSIYILWRTIHWLKKVSSFFKHKWMQGIIVLVYIILSSTIIVGSLLPKSNFQILVKKISNYWLGTFIFIIFFMIIADIIVLLLKLINKKKKISILKQKKSYYTIGIVVILCSFIVTVKDFTST